MRSSNGGVRHDMKSSTWVQRTSVKEDGSNATESGRALFLSEMPQDLTLQDLVVEDFKGKTLELQRLFFQEKMAEMARAHHDKEDGWTYKGKTNARAVAADKQIGSFLAKRQRLYPYRYRERDTHRDAVRTRPLLRPRPTCVEQMCTRGLWNGRQQSNCDLWWRQRFPATRCLTFSVWALHSREKEASRSWLEQRKRTMRQHRSLGSPSFLLST